MGPGDGSGRVSESGTRGPFRSTDEFLRHFDFDGSAYSDPTPLRDVTVGFSVLREYPRDLPYKPPRNRNGEPDVVALLKVIYEDPNDPHVVWTPQRAPIRLQVGTYSHSWPRALRYDPTDPEQPTPDSLEASRKTPQPIHLIRVDSVFFNHNAGVFEDTARDRVVADGRELLDHLFDLHCSTCRGLRRLRVQGFLKAKNRLVRLIAALHDRAHWALRVFFGRELGPQSDLMSSLGVSSPKVPRIVVDEQISFLGYKVPMNTAITFSGLLLLSILAGGVRIHGWLGGSQLFSFALGLFSLWLLDYFGPRLLGLAIKGLSRLRAWLALRQLRVRD